MQRKVWHHFPRSATAFLCALAAASCRGETCKPNSSHIAGELVDTTGAAIVGAELRVPGSAPLRTDAHGRFVSPCLPLSKMTIRVTADRFEPVDLTMSLGTETRPLTLVMKPATVETVVDAVADTVETTDFAGAETLKEEALKQMADDPDELGRQLQVLAAVAGGAPGQAIIAVDGFQNGGRIPPKSSIAYIRVNPDLFSAEYERAPYLGGRIEIYTKPGLNKLHGALFTTLSSAWMNAKDPYSLTRAPLGRQRFGFELSGPIVARKSDFSIALEHRQIDHFSVVNAVVLDATNNPVPYVANVASPQSLYSGSARLGWIVTPKNNVSVSYTANVNALENQDVGGTTLEQAGYGSAQSEHVLHLSNLQTVSAGMLHETRVGYTWRSRVDTPSSSQPSLQVAGSFTSGGNSIQALSAHERDLEVDDDILFSAGKHSMKIGFEVLDFQHNDLLPTNSNGSYTFGGGVLLKTAAVLPDGTVLPAGTGLTGLQQYQLGLPATVYTVTTGTPSVSFNQLRVALYSQDQWKVSSRLMLTLGLRYALQSAPNTYANFGPRLGLAWSPDKKQTWVLHLRSGLFNEPINSSTFEESLRLDGGQHQIQSQTYTAAGVTTTIATTRQLAPHLQQVPSWQNHVGIEKELPGHWHLQGNFYFARGWDLTRSSNINAPTSNAPAGPRPLGANQNVFQLQQTANLHGNVLFAGVDQRSLKRFQIFAAYVRMDLRSDTDSDTYFPQSSVETEANNRSEAARPTWEATHHLIAFSTISLPGTVSFSLQFDAASGVPFNVTTGFDNNGDGVFNDRPHYADPNDPTGTSYYNTRFGRLASYGTGPTVTRNAATLPWSIHTDVNLSRTFALNHSSATEPKKQTLTANLRSTNVLNHTNVTAVGGVLGSPLFGLGFASDPGRRIELGLRYSF